MGTGDGFQHYIGVYYIHIYYIYIIYIYNCLGERKKELGLGRKIVLFLKIIFSYSVLAVVKWLELGKG